MSLMAQGKPAINTIVGFFLGGFKRHCVAVGVAICEWLPAAKAG